MWSRHVLLRNLVNLPRIVRAPTFPPVARSLASAAVKKEVAVKTPRKRRLKSQPESEPQAPQEQLHPAESPKSVDLASGVPAGSHWQSVERWVVFSDLHVSARTSDVCCQVLDRVKAEAAARKAGVLFLGDFWQQRGALPVTPLNAVLEKFKEWPFPTIMLVGNHDQVSMEGLQHGVTPLAAACPAVHIMDAPTTFLDALWLPYRRQQSEITDAIQAAVGQAKVIFAHADVIGASVNELYQAKEGLMPDEFPAGTTVYTGHYHKPHTVPDTNIHYIGSPYQVSRSEATQQKRLLVLNRDWELEEEIPLDIGPRHFSLSTQADAVTELPSDLRPGDRVQWMFESVEQSQEAEPAVQELKDQGVQVEVVMKPAEGTQRIEAAESLGPLELLEAYAASTAMPADSLREATAILKELGLNGGQQLQGHVELDLHILSISGYGPFREEATYELQGRGLRVITGQNLDDPASASNGAGKSALVMAPLWAITGKTEPRSETSSASGLNIKETVHDTAKQARVKVEGTVNDKPFSVERAASRRGIASLTFQLDGQDLTMQETRMTQQQIDQHLCAQLLPRAVFHTQTDIANLLEASDSAFKQELGQVVDMQVWEVASDTASQRLKAAKEQHTRTEWTVQARRGELASRQAMAESAHEDASHTLQDIMQQEAAAEAAAETAAAAHIEAKTESIASVPEPDSAGREQLKAGVASLMTEWQTAREGLSQHQMNLGGVTEALKASKKQLQAYSPIDAELAAANVARMQDEVALCQRSYEGALQAFTTTEGHIQQAQQRLNQAQARLDAAEREAAHARQAAAAADQQRRQVELQEQQQRQRAMYERQQRRRDAASQVESIDRVRARLQRTMDSQAPWLEVQPSQDPLALPALPYTPGASIMDTAERCAEGTRAAAAQLSTAQQALASSQNQTNPFDALARNAKAMVKKVTEELQAAQQQKQALEQQVAMLTVVDKAFGRGGLQSFALEGVLQELQARTADYLRVLATGYTLKLSPTRPSKNSPDGIERVTKTVMVQIGGPDGEATVRERTMKQLSGGERRRMALALALAYGELAAGRGRLKCNLMVLDEVLQHLDGEGCARVCAVLKELPQATVLIVGQADSYVLQEFDAVDTVVKENGCSKVLPA
ncbi:hypothetical protein WJX73_005975 [Symbiochloris irregularis]|uniref:RecF/RecN/SMC N-terminal domain-containing protein n=1 Tax=Symbiochloris irregularis TaxID=706552 RepID=A0AAW1PST7_9CHLO